MCECVWGREEAICMVGVEVGVEGAGRLEGEFPRETAESVEQSCIAPPPPPSEAALPIVDSAFL